jgi:hypothetical protein
VALVELMGFAVTADITGGAITLLTVTETPADVVDNPAESVAIAVKTCVPLLTVVVSQDTE